MCFLGVVGESKQAQGRPVGEVMWHTLDVAREGLVSRAALTRWVRVLWATGCVREEHRSVAVGTRLRWGGAARRPASVEEIAGALWSRLGLAEGDECVSREQWLAHAEAAAEVVDIHIVVKMLGEVPRFL